jgi:hypothetical protein
VLPWFLVGYAVFIAVLVASAVRVALTGANKARQEMAYRVLKLIWGSGTVSALIAAAIHLLGR